MCLPGAAAPGGGVRLAIIGGSVCVVEPRHSPHRYLEEHPKIEKVLTEADIASTDADRGNGRALLMRSAHPDLSTGTMPTEGPECGTGSRSDYLIANHFGTSPSPVRSPPSTQLRLKLAANAPSCRKALPPSNRIQIVPSLAVPGRPAAKDE